METDIQHPGADMHEFAAQLWPLNRSLTGAGVNQTFDILSQRHPELRRHGFASGESVFDWDVPKQWDMRDAYIEHESGQRFAEFSSNNLHILGYSAPLDVVVDRKDLDPYLYTQADQPDRIPYVTSYYKERSGFCMSETERQSLPEGSYRLVIDSTLSDGTLNVADCIIEGDSAQEILFSTYVCHPSMANNELSGPVVADRLLRELRQRKAQFGLKYTYRVLFLVETIGAISYLSRFHQDLKRNIRAGFVLSCVGDERAYSHVESRSGDCLADKALEAALMGKPNIKRYSFLSRGSDERQFCAPGIDLPVCGFCRSKFGEFPEYHTDADDLNLVTAKGLDAAYNVLDSIVDAFEAGLYPRATTLCEPQLGKRGLYPTISQKGSYDAVKLRMNIIAYSDGKSCIFDIAKRINAPLASVNDEIKILSSNGLIAFDDHN
jgi:aminopeptidase-like protein